jgi:threonyl-tRNA synthetase
MQNFKCHRELSKEMELFLNIEQAQGAPILLENGLIIYKELANLMSSFLKRKASFHEVRSPALVKASLWKQSGHLDKFKENMFLLGEDQELMGLKPMNCPIHMLIFDSVNRSYKELPYRIHDQGILHRKENSGSLLGLARLSQFHQDDSHIFLAESQIEEEFKFCLGLIKQVYERFNFSYKACLSTRPKEYLGDLEVWSKSEAILKSSLDDNLIEYSIDAGGGAFYGPKVSVEIEDSVGRWWQVATVQLDFNLPERFNLKYVDSNGEYKRPVVIHMALYGAIERFMAIYLEHVQGNLPFKIAPQQVKIYPISDRHIAFANEIKAKLQEMDYRVVVSCDSEPLSVRLYEGRRFRAPYSIVIGDNEVNKSSLSVSLREDSKRRELSLDDLLLELKKQNEFCI